MIVVVPSASKALWKVKGRGSVENNFILECLVNCEKYLMGRCIYVGLCSGERLRIKIEIQELAFNFVIEIKDMNVKK